MRRFAAVSLATIVALVTLGFSVELLRSHFVANDVGANYVTLPFSVVLFTLLIATVMSVRRPSASAALLLAGAAGTGVGAWRFSTHPWCAAVGFVVAFSTALLPLHAAVVHGAGVTRAVRRMLAGAHGVLCTLALIMVTTAPSGVLDRWFVGADDQRHVHNEFLLWHSANTARAAQLVWWLVLLGASSVAVASRVATSRRTPPRARRAEAPVVVAAVVWVLAEATSAAFMFLSRTPGAHSQLSDYGTVVIPLVAMSAIAGTLAWVELVLPRLGRVRGGTIEMRAIAPDDDRDLRALLEDVLSTRRIDIAYATATGWVDSTGRPMSLPSGKRRATIVRRADEPLAAIVHDADLPFGAIDLGARLTAAQLDAQRATALARARADAVRAATAEIVRAGDTASLAISAELEAGPIASLQVLASDLRADPLTLSDASSRLQSVTAAVRVISHGLHAEPNGTVATLPLDED